MSNFKIAKPRYELTAFNQSPLNQSFKGINGVYHPFVMFHDRNGQNYTPQQQQQELDRLERMGVQMVRSFFGPSLTWNPETKNHDFESERMQAFYRYCKELEKRQINIGLFAGWDIRIFKNIATEGYISTANLSTGYGIAVQDDLNASCENYKNFIKNAVLAFEQHGITNIKCFFGFTECNNCFNTREKWDDKVHTQFEKREYDRLIPLYNAAICALDDGLKESGLRDRYKIVAPCDNWRADDGSEPYSVLVKYTLQNLSDRVDIIGSHRGYDRSNSYHDDWFFEIPQKKLRDCCNVALAAGKEFWIDEYNVAVNAWTLETFRETQPDPWKGTALGAMAASVMDMGASTAFLWSLCDQVFTDSTANNQEFVNGLQIGGYLQSFLETPLPHASWYACSLITRYFGTGMVYRCSQGDGVYLACLQNEHGEVSFLVTNSNRTTVPITVSLKKPLAGQTLYRRLYNPATIQPTEKAELIGVSKIFENVTADFCDELPSGAVAVYTTRND